MAVGLEYGRDMTRESLHIFSSCLFPQIATHFHVLGIIWRFSSVENCQPTVFLHCGTRCDSHWGYLSSQELDYVTTLIRVLRDDVLSACVQHEVITGGTTTRNASWSSKDSSSDSTATSCFTRNFRRRSTPSSMQSTIGARHALPRSCTSSIATRWRT